MVVSYWEGLVVCLGEGNELRGVRSCRGSLIGDNEGDGTTWVERDGEAKGEEAVRVAKDASGDVGKGGHNSESVWVRGRGLARSKEPSLGTWEGGWPHFNGRGNHTRNLLGGRSLPSFVLALAARAGARGGLCVGEGEDIVEVEVAGGDGAEDIPPLPHSPAL